MKASTHIFSPSPTPRATNWLSRLTLLPTLRLRNFLPLLALLPLTGCYSIKIHRVSRTMTVPVVLDATVETLLADMQTRYSTVQTLSAAVEIAASEGGERTGEVKDIPTFSGYLWLRKPADLRVLLLLPVIRSHALDMVSNGADFKMVIPPKSRAIVGSERIATPSPNGLENLRPGIIRDALLIPPLKAGELVDLVDGSRLVPAPPKHHKASETDSINPEKESKEMLEEPDYDLTILKLPPPPPGKDEKSQQDGHLLERVRVIHISRVTLLPYEQDVYEGGKVITKVEYFGYQKISGMDVPTSILITRPLENYKLKLNLSRITLNQPQTDDTYVLKIPEGITIQKM